MNIFYISEPLAIKPNPRNSGTWTEFYIAVEFTIWLRLDPGMFGFHLSISFNTQPSELHPCAWPFFECLLLKVIFGSGFQIFDSFKVSLCLDFGAMIWLQVENPKLFVGLILNSKSVLLITAGFGSSSIFCLHQVLSSYQISINEFVTDFRVRFGA